MELVFVRHTDNINARGIACHISTVIDNGAFGHILDNLFSFSDRVEFDTLNLFGHILVKINTLNLFSIENGIVTKE